VQDSVTADGSGVMVGGGESATSGLGTGEDAALPTLVGCGSVVGTATVERTGAAFVAPVVSVAAACVASIILVAAEFGAGESMADEPA